jgi:hypothetical protein
LIYPWRDGFHVHPEQTFPILRQLVVGRIDYAQRILFFTLHSEQRWGDHKAPVFLSVGVFDPRLNQIGAVVVIVGHRQLNLFLSGGINNPGGSQRHARFGARSETGGRYHQ